MFTLLYLIWIIILINWYSRRLMQAPSETFRRSIGHSGRKKGNRSLALVCQHHQSPISSFCSSPAPVQQWSLVLLSANPRSQGKSDAALGSGRWSFWSYQTQGSTQATFLQGGEARPPISTSLPLKAGVTVPALNTNSWLRSGRHVAAGLTKTLQVFYRMI